MGKGNVSILDYIEFYFKQSDENRFYLLEDKLYYKNPNKEENPINNEHTYDKIEINNDNALQNYIYITEYKKKA